jgi:hypothetical protein
MSKDPTAALKLEIDLVPHTMWGKNLRAVVKRSVWEHLRKEEIEKANGVCCVCASNERLHCHEVWEFDEENFKQTLAGLEVICEMCHHVHHYGNSLDLFMKGKLDIQKVEAHFLTVNQTTKKVLESHLKAAQKEWKRRSKYQWDLDFGAWSNLVSAEKLEAVENPELGFIKSLQEHFGKK